MNTRTEAWRSLFTKKGWLEDNKIILPKDFKVYLYFTPSTTDINSIQSISLSHVVSVDEDFLVHALSSSEEEYYLWDDIQCVKVKQKKAFL